MLKPNGMSDAAAEKKDDKAAAAGGGNKKVLIIIVAVNVALAGAVGGFMFMSSKDKSAERAKGGHAKNAAGEHEGDDEGGEGEEGGEDDSESHAKSQFGPLLEVGSFVANLQSPPGQPPRYIKVNVSVEAQNEEAKMRVESALIPIKTEALMMLSNAKVEDVVGQEKIIALSEQLTKRANKLIGKKSIKRVYFSELVVQ